MSIVRSRISKRNPKVDGIERVPHVMEGDRWDCFSFPIYPGPLYPFVFSPGCLAMGFDSRPECGRMWFVLLHGLSKWKKGKLIGGPLAKTGGIDKNGDRLHHCESGGPSLPGALLGHSGANWPQTNGDGFFFFFFLVRFGIGRAGCPEWAVGLSMRGDG